MEKNYLTNFKLLIELSRWIPLLFAIILFICIIILFFGIKLLSLDYLFGVSIFNLLYLYLISYVLKFCFYHRINLHYILISTGVCLYDKYIGIPVDLFTLFIIHIVLFALLICNLIYFKFLKK